MPDEPKPLTDDRERMERYLVWRDIDRRIRRRRRTHRAFVLAAVGVVGVSVFAWLSYGTRLTASLRQDSPSQDSPSADVARATSVVGATGVAPVTDDAVNAKPPTAPALTPPPPTTPAMTAPAETARVPAASTPPTVAVRRAARATVHTPARESVPDRVGAEPSREPPPPSAGPGERATTSDLSASAAPPDDWPASRADERRAPEPRVDATTPRIVPWTEPPNVAPPTAQAPAPAPPSPAAVAPGTVTSIASKPPCDDVIGGESAEGRTRGQRAADCAGGWLKGESREFRDGVTRGLDEFRAGIDKVGRGLQWLGGKLRRSE
jgi:hypothetical protein